MRGSKTWLLSLFVISVVLVTGGSARLGLPRPRRSRQLLGVNSWYYYCLSSETSSCPPCDLYPAYPCKNDDGDGGDDQLCSLPAYYGGNVADDSICGYWQTPRNLGIANLTATINGQQSWIGDILSFMDLDGMWRGTFRLKCPYMMRVDAASQLYIKVDVTNSDGRSWSAWTNYTLYAEPRRTCTSMAIQMETPATDPCKSNNITMTVRAFVEATNAQAIASIASQYGGTGGVWGVVGPGN